MDKYLKLLETYTLEELIASMELEPAELLELLEAQGYEINVEIPV